MNTPLTAPPVAETRLRLAGCVLDLETGELRTAGGQLAPLRRQALEVLLALGHRAGEVVSKEELMRRVWHDVVVGEGSLTHADRRYSPRPGDAEHILVRNIARRGYMLVPDHPAEAAAGEHHADQPAAATPPVTPSATTERRREATSGSRQLRTAAAFVAVACLLALGGWLISTQPSATAWQTPASASRPSLPKEMPHTSVAILPLAIEGEALGSEWLADALHGDLITEIARPPGGPVIGRDTMATYKGKVIVPQDVARELGVRNVVRGSLRREGEQIRLNLALIDGDSGAERWAESFTTHRATLAQTLGEFAVQLERVLHGEMYRAGAARRKELSAEQVSADDLAMRALALWQRGFSRDNVVEALAMMERAVVLDRDSVRAWNGVAFMNLHGALNDWLPSRAAAMQRVEVAAAELDRIDPGGSYTYNAKTIPLFSKGDTVAMLRHTREWTERHHVPLAFGAYGAALMFNGHFDEAVRAQEQALRLSPRDPFRAEWQYRLAMAHFAAGRYELARDWAQTAATTSPAVRWPPVHAAALWQLGQKDTARERLAEYRARHGRFQAAQALARLPGTEPRWVAARVRLVENLAQVEASE
jgi:TolB-like protein/DNA-binding winged helix-turn-helix (wHTH) protein